MLLCSALAEKISRFEDRWLLRSAQGRTGRICSEELEELFPQVRNALKIQLTAYSHPVQGSRRVYIHLGDDCSTFDVGRATVRGQLFSLYDSLYILCEQLDLVRKSFYLTVEKLR